jgi:hypothetical protein
MGLLFTQRGEPGTCLHLHWGVGRKATCVRQAMWAHPEGQAVKLCAMAKATCSQLKEWTRKSRAHVHPQMLAVVGGWDATVRLHSLYCSSASLTGLNTCSFMPPGGEYEGHANTLYLNPQVAVYSFPVRWAPSLALLRNHVAACAGQVSVSPS